MLIKPVDDKSRRLTFLLNLYDSPMLNEEQKQWLDNELWSLRRNFLSEDTSAGVIDACFGESEDFAVLHDLRLHLREGAARIDHLLLARTCAFIIETRHFEGNIVIDESGNFTIEYSDGAPKTINTPLKRGQRLEKNLQEFFAAMDIKARGEPLDVFHLVMLPQESTVRRPPESKLDTSNVIKSNALKIWVEEINASQPSGGMLKGFSFGRASREKDSLREWGEKIVGHHHPDNPFYLPKFIRLKSRRAQDAAGAAEEPAAMFAASNAPASDLAPLPPAGAAGDITAPEEATQPPADAAPESAAEAVQERASDDASIEAVSEAGAAPAEQDSAPAEAAESAAEPAESAQPPDLDAEAPTQFLERGDAEAPTMFLERDAVESTQFLERDDEAPTEFLVRETPAPQPEPAPAPEPKPEPAPQPAAAPAAPAGVSVCALCGRPLMRGMVKFCQEHPKRFGGQLYCFTHQDNFPPVPEDDA